MHGIRFGLHRSSVADIAEVPAEAVLVPLHAGRFKVESTMFRLGDVSLHIGSSTPMMTMGSFAPDIVSLFLPLSAPESLILNGHEIGRNEAVAYGPGAAHDGAGYARLRWALISMPSDSVDTHLAPVAPRSSAVRRRASSAMLQVDPTAWGPIASLMRRALAVATKTPEIFSIEESFRSLRASVLNAMSELLAGPCGGPRPRVLRATPTRQRIIKAVDEFLRIDPSRVLEVDDLSRAIGSSASSLRAAFASTFAISPEKYLKLRRLTMARVALLSRESPASSVDEVAVAFGFWDDARFRQDYQAMFGETPAASFGRVRARRADGTHPAQEQSPVASAR